MFLTENGNDFVPETSVNDNLPLGEAGILALNYELSEEYHGIVESMIVAEHTAIVNEDTNLLNEATNGFLGKIAEIFKKMGAGLVSIWNKVVTFFKEKCKKAQEAMVQRKLKGVVEGSKATIKTNRTLNLSIGTNALTMANTALAEANKKIADTKSSYEAGKGEIVLYSQAFPGLSNEAAIDGEKFRAYVKEKLGVASKDEKKTEKTFTVDKTMVDYVTNYNATLKGVKEAFQNAIKAYKTLASKLDALAKSLDGTKQATTAKSAGYARKIASKLNVALGIAVSEVRAQHGLCWAIIASAKKDAKTAEKISKKINESASILDRFALI